MSLLCTLLNVMSFSKWASIASTSSNTDAALPIVCHFTQPCLTCFSLAHKTDGTRDHGGGGAHVKILTGMLVPFFLGLKFGQILLFWVGKFFSYFSGFRKISANSFGSDKFPAIFLGLPIFVSTNRRHLLLSIPSVLASDRRANNSILKAE